MAAPQSVTLLLADDIDISRGDLIAEPERRGYVTRSVGGTVCVLSERPIRPRDRVLLRAGTRTVRAMVEEIIDLLDIDTVDYRRAPQELRLNDIGRVRVRLADDLPIDDYHELRRSGAFLLIDDADGATLAAGMADAPRTATRAPTSDVSPPVVVGCGGGRAAARAPTSDVPPPVVVGLAACGGGGTATRAPTSAGPPPVMVGLAACGGGRAAHDAGGGASRAAPSSTPTQPAPAPTTRRLAAPSRLRRLSSVLTPVFGLDA